MVMTDSAIDNGPADDLAQESWFKSDWRPAMCWLYFLICACDFILFPLGSMILPMFKLPYTPWVPITLANGGIIHMSLGAITGLYVHNRTREKLACAEGNHEILGNDNHGRAD